ncbi:MAG TPA: aromatic ring-hydroxylating dioxygenase subunit alpha [Gaiellaceae bacterium]|nr:aromatic ring-hydroxylating dioxygenase subunit alpha [Gaiellaceae bacterium]
MPETYPWAWYSDPAVLALERERIFRPAWHYVCDVGRLAEPSSYFGCTTGGLPVVVTRDRAGELRAFLNVCRHRGSEIASGAGRRETLQCPYHAWTYGLDGALRSAPRADREPGLDPSTLGLVPLRLEAWGPFLFASADPDATSPAETLEAARLPIDPAGLVFRERVHYALDANWKIAVENYLECYHCPVAHPGFSRLVDVDPDSYVLDGDGPVWSQYGQALDGSGTCAFHLVWPGPQDQRLPGVSEPLDRACVARVAGPNGRLPRLLLRPGRRRRLGGRAGRLRRWRGPGGHRAGRIGPAWRRDGPNPKGLFIA